MLLPFDTSPNRETVLVGNLKVGILRFPIFYGLLVLEQININRGLGEISPYVMTCELAQRIEQEKGFDLLLCYDAVAGDLTDKSEAEILQMRRIRIFYAREIEKISNFSETFSEQERLITVTEILTRIEPNWKLEDTYKISMPLLKSVWEFANNEIKGLEISSETTVLTKEDIKKPLDESPSLSTGVISSGDSNPTGEEMSDLPQTILLDSPVG
jgi:hypothetical protein